MKTRWLNSNFLLALLAAVASVMLVRGENHVHIVVSIPATWVGLIQHKCGCVMLACISWAIVEGVRTKLSPKPEESNWRGSSFQMHSFAGRLLQ